MLGFPPRNRSRGLFWRIFCILVFQLCIAAAIHAQPGPDRRTFYRTRIQHNADANDQLRAITDLRRQLPDTADPVDTGKRHPTRLAGQRRRCS